MASMKTRVFKFLGVILMLGLVFSTGATAATPGIIFYDEDGTTELGRLPLVQGPETGKYYLHWKELNKVPDFSKDGKTVILTWKKQGDTAGTRHVLSHNAAYHAAATEANPNPTPVLRKGLVYLEGDLKLVPLKTVTTREFDVIRYGSIVVDGHTDAPMRIVDGTTWKPLEANDLTQIEGRVSPSQALYPWLKSGGLSGALHAAFTAGYPDEDMTRGSGDRANSRILALLNATHWSVDRNKNIVQLATNSAGFKAAFDAGKIGIMQSIEGAYSLTEENYNELLVQYYDLGVRVISFTWNNNSYLAAGNLMKYRDADKVPGKEWAGLSALGKKVLARMDQLGIVYDVSHTDDKTVNDALASTANPIIASHSGARGEFDHVRNLWDPEIVAIAQRGGMIFQNFYGDFINDPRGIYEIANQIDYIVALLEKPVAQGGAGFAKGKGVEYVGIGTDYDGGTNIADANDARYFYRITKELLARGYTQAEITKIFGQNAFRVVDRVQANATFSPQGGTATITAPTASGKALVRGANYAQLDTRRPELSANVTGASSARVIVDGIVCPSTLSGGKLTASLAKTPLQESFHVVTFEATDSNKKVTRNTSIFTVGDAAATHKVEFVNADRKTLISTLYVNDKTSISSGDIPQSANGAPVTGWTVYWTEQPFDTATPLARSYRLVATVDKKSDDSSSSGGCHALGLAGFALLLAVPVFARVKK